LRHAASFALAAVLLAGCGDGPAAKEPAIEPADADRVLAAVREPGARAVLVNVWATWCAPCRVEFPDLMRIEREFRAEGLRMVLVSADFDESLPQAREFLASHGVSFPSFHKTGDDMRFINTLDTLWTGALPATLLYDGAGRRVGFWEGLQSYESLSRAVRDVLQKGRGTDTTEVGT
jgi:thiol-disulfide isomerase/thioredoxin